MEAAPDVRSPLRTHLYTTESHLVRQLHLGYSEVLSVFVCCNGCDAIYSVFQLSPAILLDSA